MTVKELYLKLSEKIPEELREEWDNDGIMCCPDDSAEVSRVLICLDVTEEIVDYAIETGFDLIVSHHPLIFRPLGAVSSGNHIGRKVIKLLTNGVSVFSFHTRADKVRGGVNDLLCDILGISGAVPFGEGFMGRVGTVDESSLEDFAYRVKELLSADGVRFADGYNTVSRVAVLGGDGKDFVKAAMEAGADTYVSGRISYNLMEEAAEMGINLVEAGHYFTEQPVCSFFYNVIKSIDQSLEVETTSSNLIKLI